MADNNIIIVFDKKRRVLAVLRPSVSNLTSYIEKTMGPDPGRFSLYAQMRPFDRSGEVAIEPFDLVMDRDGISGDKYWFRRGTDECHDANKMAEKIIETLAETAHRDLEC